MNQQTNYLKVETYTELHQLLTNISEYFLQEVIKEGRKYSIYLLSLNGDYYVRIPKAIALTIEEAIAPAKDFTQRKALALQMIHKKSRAEKIKPLLDE